MPLGGDIAKEVLKAQGAIHIKGGEKLLVRREHLEPVPKHKKRYFSLRELETLLRDYGPIYFAWEVMVAGEPEGHASVLIGTDDTTDEVIYHDPDNKPNSRMKLADFQSSRTCGTYDMLRRKKVDASSSRRKSGGS